MNALERISRRVSMALGLGRVTAPADESGPAQVLQVAFPGTLGSGPELRDRTASVQLYGFASSPVPGADAVVVFLAGDRSKGIVVATNDQRYRPVGLKPGEIMVYDNQGQSVYLSASGIVVNGNGKPVTVNADLRVNGKITATGDVVAGSISLQQHAHADPQGGMTGLPQG